MGNEANDPIVETVVPFPVKMELNSHPGGRFSFKINDEVFNFYDQEQLYIHVDDGVIGVEVTSTKQEPSKVRQYLNDLINGLKSYAPIFTRGYFNWRKHA